MKHFITFSLLVALLVNVSAQNTMTPDLLWKLGRISALGMGTDGLVYYSVRTPDWETNKGTTKTYKIPIQGGTPVEVTSAAVKDKNISPDGKYTLSHNSVKVNKMSGKDYYPELNKSNVQIYDDLMIRHWDTWEEGEYDHVMLYEVVNGEVIGSTDLMKGEPYDCPQKPFGGDEDYIWGPDGKTIIYVTKKKAGAAYAVSTNTDLYEYNLLSKTTTNLTEGRMGYDINPSYSKDGQLAFMSMRRDGYEADKQDVILYVNKKFINLTGHRDDLHVEGYMWGTDNKIYFYAATNGTQQLFVIENFKPDTYTPEIRQITKGDFDVHGIVAQSGSILVVTRCDMNHADELYTVNLNDGTMKQLTHVNDSIYNSIQLVKTERRWVETTDKKKELVWVIYPPDFDPKKQYPTLLYCQGGPQGALTQFYSFRWNFQLMASQGYIVVAPNRRGMPGHGTAWNEEISKDHGGQAMKDYLCAIDAVSKESYVDKSRVGAVGASYGGYSVFMLAGMHEGRFKSFISHDGIYDMRSMYGTTEELFFVDWDWGGPYWDLKNKAAQKTYEQFNPINFVDKWDTPIMIVQGGKDYRVPVEQGLQAFQAAKLKGLNSRLLYLPDENHWVLSAQNALVWQREFYRWLKETMPEKSATTPGKS